MSNWNKASKLKQTVHRERSQPAHRSKLGLLEKKKDYKLRAYDFQSKLKALKRLRQMALNRNPDEFHCHMINTKLNKDGLLYEKNKWGITSEQRKIIEGKTLSYVRAQSDKERHQVNKFASQLQLVDYHAPEQKHIFFRDQNTLSEGKKVASTLLLPSTNFNKFQGNNKLSELRMNQIRRLNHLRRQSYERLSRMIDRKQKLSVIRDKMEVMAALKKKTYFPPKLLKPATTTSAPIYEWKYERSR